MSSSSQVPAHSTLTDENDSTSSQTEAKELKKVKLLVESLETDGFRNIKQLQRDEYFSFNEETQSLQVAPILFKASKDAKKRTWLGAYIRFTLKNSVSLRKISSILSSDGVKVGHVQIQRKHEELIRFCSFHNATASLSPHSSPLINMKTFLAGISESSQQRQFEETVLELNSFLNHTERHETILEHTTFSKELYDIFMSLDGTSARLKTKLSPFAEKCVAFFIIGVKNEKRPLFLQDLLRFANHLLRLESSTKGALTECWWRSFKKRHKKFGFCATVKINHVVESKKKTAEKLDEELFGKLLKLKETRDFSLDRVFNADETFFNSRKNEYNLRLVGQKGTVLHTSNIKNTQKSLEHITMMFTVCASNDRCAPIVPPYFVYARKGQESEIEKGDWKQYSNINVPDNIFPLRSSVKGWFSERIFDDWIRHFCYWTECSPTNPALLLIDSAPCHKNIAFSKYQRENGLYIRTLPPGRTWLLQPCDTNVFNEIKIFMTSLERKSQQLKSARSMPLPVSTPIPMSLPEQEKRRILLLEKLEAFKIFYKCVKYRRYKDIIKANPSASFKRSQPLLIESLNTPSLEMLEDPKFYEIENIKTSTKRFFKELETQRNAFKPIVDKIVAGEVVGAKRKRTPVESVRLPSMETRSSSSSSIAAENSAAVVEKKETKSMKGKRLLRNEIFTRFFMAYFTHNFNDNGRKAFFEMGLWPPRYEKFQIYRDLEELKRQEGRHRLANDELKRDLSGVFQSVVNFAKGAQTMIKIEQELDAFPMFKHIIHPAPLIPRKSSSSSSSSASLNSTDFDPYAV